MKKVWTQSPPLTIRVKKENWSIIGHGNSHLIQPYIQGVFDTSGNDYSYSLQMQQELRDQMGYIDLILMVIKGSETR